MSLHDFDSRTGLETMVLHFGPDSFSSHSLSPTSLDGYIVVPKADRVPLAAKSHNVQNRRIPRCGSVPAKFGVAQDISLVVPTSRPCTPVNHVLDATRNASPPFQPLPRLATSPFRLPSFLDLTAPSLRSESPSPRPIPRPLSIDIPSVSHPNSPYVPWASPVRRNILRPLTPSSHVSGFSVYSRPYSRSGARAPEPQDPDSPPPAQNKFLRLSKSFKNIRRTVKQGMKHVKNALKKTSKAKSPETVDAPIRCPPPLTIQCPSPTPPLPSPTASCESDNTTTLAVWLRQCEMNLERATPHFMTLQEYEERGSWIDLTSVRDESETHSSLLFESGADGQPERLPFPSPLSPTCPSSESFPQLSMHDIWPTPPSSVTPVRGFSAQRQREMSMPGGWDSPAAYV
ncbi:hypothetical protein B0H17DRAFT_1037355 [Mycena rosella]|uniref:Uncharacterized protein n=1 Tax=Mycena rosella TaxID=1033263 RepID=A0AAD7GWA5_MYCRO|nr:hypothetical protein B0H17DRAFT_1037355 [Mycena rosella]